MLRDLTRENCATREAGVTEFRQQPVGPAPLVEETDQSETDPREAATPRNLASVNPRRGSSTIRAAVMPAMPAPMTNTSVFCSVESMDYFMFVGNGRRSNAWCK